MSLDNEATRAAEAHSLHAHGNKDALIMTCEECLDHVIKVIESTGLNVDQVLANTTKENTRNIVSKVKEYQKRKRLGETSVWD